MLLNISHTVADSMDITSMLLLYECSFCPLSCQARNPFCSGKQRFQQTASDILSAFFHFYFSGFRGCVRKNAASGIHPAPYKSPVSSANVVSPQL